LSGLGDVGMPSVLPTIFVSEFHWSAAHPRRSTSAPLREVNTSVPREGIDHSFHNSLSVQSGEERVRDGRQVFGGCSDFDSEAHSVSNHRARVSSTTSSINTPRTKNNNNSSMAGGGQNLLMPSSTLSTTSRLPSSQPSQPSSRRSSIMPPQDDHCVKTPISQTPQYSSFHPPRYDKTADAAIRAEESLMPVGGRQCAVGGAVKGGTHPRMLEQAPLGRYPGKTLSEEGIKGGLHLLHPSSTSSIDDEDDGEALTTLSDCRSTKNSPAACHNGNENIVAFGLPDGSGSLSSSSSLTNYHHHIQQQEATAPTSNQQRHQHWANAESDDMFNFY